MDEVSEITDDKFPWAKDEITDNCFLIRHTHYIKRIKIGKKRRHPSEAAFIVRNGEDGLSFNWMKYADEERSNILLGLFLKANGEFMNLSDYKFFKLPVHIIRSIDGISNIEYKPDYNGNPSPIGLPNNKSHSIVRFKNSTDPSDNLQIRVELREYCNEHYEELECIVDDNKIENTLDELRPKGNDTPYHKLWEFDD